MLGSSTLEVVPVNQQIQAWLEAHAEQINKIADILHLAPEAIAAPLAQEAGGIIFDREFQAKYGWISSEIVDDPLEFSNFGIYKEQQFDKLLDDSIDNLSNKQIKTDYDRKYSEIIGGIDTSIFGTLRRWAEKIISPTANDLGWGNVNLGTAISTVQQYLIDPRYKDDPLNLRKYDNHYDALARDLINPHSTASFSIAGLIARQGDDYYNRVYGSQYAEQSDQVKAALLTTHFKQGAGKTQRHLPDPIDPKLPDPLAGDGGPDIMDENNWRILQKSLARPWGNAMRPQAASAAKALTIIGEDLPFLKVGNISADPARWITSSDPAADGRIVGQLELGRAGALGDHGIMDTSTASVEPHYSSLIPPAGAVRDFAFTSRSGYERGSPSHDALGLEKMLAYRPPEMSAAVIGPATLSGPRISDDTTYRFPFSVPPDLIGGEAGPTASALSIAGSHEAGTDQGGSAARGIPVFSTMATPGEAPTRQPGARWLSPSSWSVPDVESQGSGDIAPGIAAAPAQGARPSPAGASKEPAHTEASASAIQGTQGRSEVELDGRALGHAVTSALERLVGGPNTGPASVNSAQIYTPPGMAISGHQ